MSACRSSWLILIPIFTLGCAPKANSPQGDQGKYAQVAESVRSDASTVNSVSVKDSTHAKDSTAEAPAVTPPESAERHRAEPTSTETPDAPASETETVDGSSETKNPEPMSFTEIARRVDLRKIAIPEDGSFDRRSLSEAWMRVARDVSTTADYVREQLSQQGCKEIDPLFELTEPHVGLAFEAGDVLVTAFITPESNEDGEKWTHFSINVIGNLDTRKLPALEETETKDARRSNVQLVTSKPVQETVATIIETFTNAGWTRFEDPTGVKPTPNADPQNLAFIRNAIVVTAYVSAKAVFRNKGKTTILLTQKVLGSELPLVANSKDLSIDVNVGRLRCKTTMSIVEVADFYRNRFASLGWTEMKGSRVTDENALLRFQFGNDITLVDASKSKDGTDLEVVGLIEKHPEDEKRAIARDEARQRAKETNPIVFPIPEGAEQIKLSEDRRDVEYRVLMSTNELADFYRKAFAEIGWKEHSRFTNLDDHNANMNFSDEKDDSTAVNCLKLDNEKLTRVSAHAIRFTWNLPDVQQVADSDQPTEPDPVERLVAEMHDGIPVPNDHSDLSSSGSRFRREIQVTSPSSFSRVQKFYVTQLSELGWKESRRGSEEELVFTRDEDQLLVRLARKNEQTKIDLEIKFTGAAKKAGILPEPGAVLVIVGNEGKDTAELTVGEEMISIEPGVGTKEPDGPRIRLEPGTHKIRAKIGSIKHREKLKAGADQTWALVLRPGGPVLLRMY